MDRRAESLTPYVMGVLMVVFGGLGLIVKVHALHTNSFDVLARLPRVDGTVVALRSIAIFVGVIQVLAGIHAMTFRPNALRWAVAYALAAIAYTIAVWSVAFGSSESVPRRSGIFDSLAADLLAFGSIVSIAWPVVVVIAMTRGRARAACRPTDHPDVPLPTARWIE